jgi:hypothetical protein
LNFQIRYIRKPSAEKYVSLPEKMIARSEY